MKKVDFNKLQADDLVEVPRTQFAPVCGRSTGFQLLFNAKSSPHGKTKRQNRRAAHMERQRAPPKGREAENGSRGIDSRGRIPERLCRCHSRYAKEKRAEAAAGAGKESLPLVFH